MFWMLPLMALMSVLTSSSYHSPGESARTCVVYDDPNDVDKVLGLHNNNRNPYAFISFIFILINF